MNMYENKMLRTTSYQHPISLNIFTDTRKIDIYFCLCLQQLIVDWFSLTL